MNETTGRIGGEFETSEKTKTIELGNSSNPNSSHLSVKQTGVLTSLLSFVCCSSELLTR